MLEIGAEQPQLISDNENSKDAKKNTKELTFRVIRLAVLRVK